MYLYFLELLLKEDLIEERMNKYKNGNYALPALHSPYYYPEVEKTIETGVLVTTNALIYLFNK